MTVEGDDPVLAGACKVVSARGIKDQKRGADTTLTLHDDGCITCSDAGIPVRVLSVEGDDALCEDSAGTRAKIAVDLVAPVRRGEVLLTHGGVAIGKVATEPPT